MMCSAPPTVGADRTWWARRSAGDAGGGRERRLREEGAARWPFGAVTSVQPQYAGRDKPGLTARYVGRSAAWVIRPQGRRGAGPIIW